LHSLDRRSKITTEDNEAIEKDEDKSLSFSVFLCALCGGKSLGVSMSQSVSSGYAFNRTRRQYLATRLTVAKTHWSRFIGLIGKTTATFPQGRGLWIVPCRGVHTVGMRIPIDVVYLTENNVVLHLESSLRPWRFAPIRIRAASVLELPENTLRSTGTTIGDELEIDPHRPGEHPPA
jgi:uncharacterized protein